jgi:long-chain fatty acid transport protein
MKLKSTLVFSAWAVTAAPVFANGFYIPVQAPEATGRGNAWLATADTASAVYYNAAGLTQLESTEWVLGAYSVRLGIEMESDLNGQTYKNDASWALLPQVYAGVPISDRLVAGFGINTPFGLATDWGSNTIFRQLAIETELTYATGWAVLGYKLSDTLSIGGGLGVHHADLMMKQGIVFGQSDSFKFNGNSEALSWTLSALWKPLEQHSFGAVFRSKTDFLLKGDAENSYVPGDVNASMDLITPATAAVGYAYKPCAEWTLEANLEWVNWEELNTLTLSQDGGADISVPFNWKSNFIYSLGATRFFENGWNASAGYNYIENSQPDGSFNPGVSDADRHWINVGVGRQYESFKWNFAYQYAFSDRDVSGSPGTLADGTFKSRFHGLMFNCNLQF